MSASRRISFLWPCILALVVTFQTKATGSDEPLSDKKPDVKSDSLPLEKAAEEDPAKRPYNKEARQEYNQGVELHQQGFLNQAIHKYKAAIALEDRMEEAHCNLGLIYASQRNYSKAAEAFKKALSIKPGNPYTLNGLGTVLYAKGKLEDALVEWKKALEADPNFASAYFNMGNAFENEKDYGKSLDNYVLALKVKPDMADAYYKIGNLFIKQKHPAQANTCLAKALQLTPDADFAFDARKQLNSLAEQFAHENKEPEVQMNVLAPPSQPDKP